MAQEFKQSEHFNTFECLSGYLQLRWKNDVIIDDPADEDYCDKEVAMDIFNEWIDEHEDEWSNYTFFYENVNGNELMRKSSMCLDDESAEDYAIDTLGCNMLDDVMQVEIYDWKDNYVNTIE